MNLTSLLNLIFTILIVAIFAKVVLSFVIPMAGARPHPALISINYWVTRVTEPMLGPLRRVLPTFGMFDFSPMVALLILFFIQNRLPG